MEVKILQSDMEEQMKKQVNNIVVQGFKKKIRI